MHPIFWNEIHMTLGPSIFYFEIPHAPHILKWNSWRPWNLGTHYFHMKFFMSPKSVKILWPSYFGMKFMEAMGGAVPMDLGPSIFYFEIPHAPHILLWNSWSPWSVWNWGLTWHDQFCFEIHEVHGPRVLTILLWNSSCTQYFELTWHDQFCFGIHEALGPRVAGILK